MVNIKINILRCCTVSKISKDGKWLCHCAQFWLQEVQCLEVLKDCHRERHRGLLHAAAGGICNLNWKWVNRIPPLPFFFNTACLVEFFGLWTFLLTYATSLMEQLVPLLEGHIAWWFPAKLHIKSPLHYNLRFIFVISEHALSSGHWNTVFQNCSISKTWKLKYCNLETGSHYLPEYISFSDPPHGLVVRVSDY